MTRTTTTTVTLTIPPYGLIRATVTWELSRFLYGTDADGNRGEMRDEIEPVNVDDIEILEGPVPWRLLGGWAQDDLGLKIQETAEYEE